MSNLSSGTAMPVSYDSNASRILSVDVLRGVALFGILLISIWELGGFNVNEQMGLRLSQKGFDYNLFASVLVLFEGKMRALFSLVFGVGIMLFLTKPNHFSLPQSHELYIRRQLWLMAFGVVNAFVFLWPGDILFQYGVMGILLFPFFRMSKKGLLIAAMIATLIYCGKMYWYYADDKTTLRKYKAVMLVEEKFKKDSTARHRKDSLAGMSKDSILVRDSIDKKKDTLNKMQMQEKSAWEGMTKNLKYDSTKAMAKADKKAMGSGYGKIWNHLLMRSQGKESMWLYQIGIWDIGSLMLLGMALFGFGFFGNNFSKTKYLLFALTGIAVGFFLAWCRLHMNHDKLVDYEKYIGKNMLPPNQFFPIERLLMAVGYASLIMWFIRVNFLQWFWRALGAVGRMAFTNYLMQTIICTLFFYGYGFGYFGRLSLKELYFFVAEIWLVQTVFSILWLRFYEYGPVEWLWRWLIYGKRFPNKKKTEAS
jgi:uncharacterized protein